MPSTITLDGVRPGFFARVFSRRLHGVDDRGKWLGDAWSDDAAAADAVAANPVADFTVSAVGWGVLAFAAGTAAIRGYRLLKKHTPKLAGARRRRR